MATMSSVMGYQSPDRPSGLRALDSVILKIALLYSPVLYSQEYGEYDVRTGPGAAALPPGPR